ncbi:KICSTOR subunit 2-like [Saccoglossus kowalevskii]|uniref:UPF0536 protein C12orf66-like n=1 Tax=Saccoglossus kowalevskii TaxID=10224 RepID=A0ABM0MEB0_SACKO|nr:PREDICTED: UPF0536 protein C12orf66-like [Saccoglossus kowalevskii]
MAEGPAIPISSSSTSSLESVSQEQAFLETYFLALSQFAYDKAKEYADKERDSRKNTYGSTWGQMLFALSHLATAEKTYSGLLFLGQKWFGRKDSLRTSYVSLLNELHKIENIGRLAMGGTAPFLERLLSHLSGQLCQYVQARQEFMDLHSKNFHHPILSPLKSSVSLEFDLLLVLLQAEVDISQWKFLQSLLKIHEAHSKSEPWRTLLRPKEAKKKMPSSHKLHANPPLYLWILKYKDALVSKFSLYFHEVLSKQAPIGDIKTVMSKIPTDFYTKIVSFHKKTDAFNISLVFNVRGCESTYTGHGYHHPEALFIPVTGLDSYPAVVSYPNDRPISHWPNVVMLISSKISELESHDRILYFYDKNFQSTYYICKVDNKMMLVLLYESKKNEKDSHVNTFMSEMSSQLRSNKLFASLKTGSKS